MYKKLRRILTELIEKVYAYRIQRIYGSKLVLMEGSTIDHKSQIHIFGNGSIHIHENASLRSSPIGYHGGMPFPCSILVDGPNARVNVGRSSRLNGAYIHAKRLIDIGDNCVIASGVNVIDSNGHNLTSSDRTSGADDPKPIRIGNNVWISMNAIILKGTTIGDNCVIGANSVVKGDFPRNSLIIGNPARVVKTLDISKPELTIL
ncbi:MAG: acyltransferase [Gammaproteobacteria bacterium]|nr:acyltransferase [Gammaproteobacteria bacterium]